MRVVEMPTILVRPAGSSDLDAVLGLLGELRWDRHRDGGTVPRAPRQRRELPAQPTPELYEQNIATEALA